MRFAVVLFSWICSLSFLATLVLLITFLVHKGGKSLDLELIFGQAPIGQALTGKAPVFEGLLPALAGTLALVLLAVGFAAPFGLGAGIYLALLASGRLKRYCNFCIDLLASIPSIVIGLFGFALILFLRRTLAQDATTCLLLSAGGLGILILPYLVWAAQNGLDSLTAETRLIGPSLGLSLRQNLLHILLPLASRPILGGIILATGRAAEDTAVILLTGAVANAGLPASLFHKFEALPFFIYYTAAEYRTPEELSQGFGACLILLALSASLFLLAIILEKGLTRGWTNKQ